MEKISTDIKITNKRGRPRKEEGSRGTDWNERQSMKEYNKQYYQKNKETKWHLCREETFCELCRTTILKTSMQYHIKGKKHTENLKKL